jgi:hypothetical protein
MKKVINTNPKLQLLEAKLRKMIREELSDRNSDGKILIDTMKRLRSIKEELENIANYKLNSIDVDAESAVHDIVVACVRADKMLRKIYDQDYDESDTSELGAPTSR